MRHIKRCLKIAEYVLAAVLLGITLFAAVEYAQGIQPIYVVSDYPSSMSPTINYGDAFIVYPVDFNSLQPNDIVAFKDPRGNAQTIVHRVVTVDASDSTNYLITKGDNDQTNPIVDPWDVTENYYAGKVILVIPYFGYLSPALWGLSGSVFIILGISAIVVILMVNRLTKKTKINASEENA